MNSNSFVSIVNDFDSLSSTTGAFYDRKHEQFNLIKIDKKDNLIMLNQKFDN